MPNKRLRLSTVRRLVRMFGVPDEKHDPRCMTLTSSEFPEVCDCRTLRMLDAFAAEENPPAWQGCEVPPDGWWCSREKGHTPPCAARPGARPNQQNWSE